MWYGGRALCRFTCDTSLTDKAVPYMPAEDGREWPWPSTAGCSCGADADGVSAAAGEEALRGQVQQYEQQVQALKAEVAALKGAASGGGA